MPAKKPVWSPVPLTVVASAEKPGPLHVYQDCWWLVDTEGNAFVHNGTSPMCNRNKAIVERFAGRAEFPPGCTAQFLPWGYLKFNIQDYT